LHFVAESHRLLHPTRAARTGAGIVGELHPTQLDGEWGVLELDLGLLFEEVTEPIVYHDVLAYPAVRQELAFVLDVEVPAADVFDAARRVSPEVREVRFLSDYRGARITAGKKSLAFSVAFQSAERTLTDEDAASLRARVIEAVERTFRAELRG